MNHYLPVKTDVIIKSRHSNALQMSVVQACLNDKDLSSWLSGEFINVIFDAGTTMRYDFHREDFWFVGQKLTTKQHMTFENSILQFKSFNAIEYICEAISSGSYIMGDFNAFYIRAKVEYGILNRNIDYLIYGYDDCERTFSVLGNTRESVFTSFTVGFDEYLEAIRNREDKLFNLNIITFNKKKEHDISLPLIYRKLKDYLLSECSTVLRHSPSTVFGVGAWEWLKKEYKAFVGICDYFDYRAFMVLSEHKKIMLHRIEYLMKRDIISDQNIRSSCRRVCQIAEEAMNICDSYNRQRDFSRLGELDRILDEIVCVEKEYLSALLWEIESRASGC